MLPNSKTLSYASLVDSVVETGLSREQVLQGSIPELSLLEMFQVIQHQYSNSALLGLHIGNFVGISLVYLTRLLIELNPKTHIIAIDPNIPHRGIRNPQEKVLYLLYQYGLTKNVSLLTGFSLEKNISNDGNEYTSYNPLHHYNAEYSCENQLEFLKTILGSSLSFAVLDGNHDQEYLQREISIIESLLCENGLIILDDVSEGWKEIKKTYDTADTFRFEKIFANGRIGILKKKRV